MQNIGDYIKSGKNVFLVGIGGVSMCSLAEVLRSRGVNIRGSDMRLSDNIKMLIAKGFEVSVGHSAGNLDGSECVIRTAAAREDNPEIIEARSRQMPVFERAQAWSCIMSEFENVVCISGTHGKTTTTSMVTSIAIEEKIAPTAMIGGELPKIGASYCVGNGNTIIAEADEYCNSFLNFNPTVAVIQNIEADHLDFFSGLDDIISSFRKFASNTSKNGCIIVNSDDINSMRAVTGVSRRTVTFGIDSGDIRARNIEVKNGLSTFDIIHGNGLIPITLTQPGRHNIYNALAAAAAALELGIDGVSIARGLETFTGAKRRFEYKGEYRGAKIYDDYAHHPTELRALLDAAEALGYRRVIVAFQPHTYSRTKALFGDFVTQLRRPDLAVLLPIFAARERFDNTISSEMLAEKAGCKAVGGFKDAADLLRDELGDGDLFITVGAGEAYTVGDLLRQNFAQNMQNALSEKKVL